MSEISPGSLGLASERPQTFGVRVADSQCFGLPTGSQLNTEIDSLIILSRKTLIFKG